MSLDLGDVPTWLATVGAGIAAYFASRAYLIERRRDAVAADILRQEQASHVAVWTDYGPHPYTNEPDGADYFVLRNASQLPIYEVIVFSYSFERTSSIETARPVGQFHLGTVPPEPTPTTHTAYLSTTSAWAFAIQFRDAAGVVWYRDPRGELWESDFPDLRLFKREYIRDEL
ncbi:hypothetical protein WEI85_34875 [Actinomycetes bacterium KLBMP 9797]